MIVEGDGREGGIEYRVVLVAAMRQGVDGAEHSVITTVNF
jgi:hypothetical protein